MTIEMTDERLDDATAAPLLADALGFAKTVYGEACDGDPRLAAHAPAAFAAYAAALAELTRLHPDEAAFGQPLALLDEAAFAWSDAAFWEGASFALEADRLRRSLLAMATGADG